MPLSLTGDMCADGVVPIVLTLLGGLVTLLSGRYIMKMERSRSHTEALTKDNHWFEEYVFSLLFPFPSRGSAHWSYRFHPL